MEKKHIKAHIECNSNGFYTVYHNEDLPFGFFGEGNSAKAAREDFLATFEAMRDDHLKRTGENVEAEFEFVYDASAFLQHYKGLLTLAGLSRMSKLNLPRTSVRMTPRD